MLAVFILLLLGAAAPAHATLAHWTALGPEGGALDVVDTDPTNPLIVFAGGMGGLRKSVDGGATWSDLTAGLERRPGVWTMSIDPSDPNRMLVGGLFMGAGVHATVDGGAHWTQIFPGLPYGGEIDVYMMARDPSLPQSVYLAGGDGFFKSTNGGASWAPIGTGLVCPACLGDIEFDPPNANVVYIANGYGDLLQKSVDGGVTFAPFGGIGLPPAGIPFSLAVKGSTIYVGYYQDGIYRSTDGGATFAAANTGLPANPIVNGLEVDPTAPAKLYALVQPEAPATPTVYASTDAGASWNATALPPAASFSPNSLAVDASGCVVVGTGGNGVWRSCTGGASWTNGIAGMRSVKSSALAADPNVSGTALLGTDGSGVWKTTDAGNTWTRTSYPEVYASVLAMAPSNPQVAYAFGGPGARTGDGGTTWTPCGSPGLAAPVVGYSMAVDPSDPNTVYVGYYSYGFLKSTDGCASWAPSNNGITPHADGRGIAIDPTDGQTLYGAASFGGAYKSTDGGASWTPLAVGVLDYPASFTVAASNPAVVYATHNGRVFRSADAGATWLDVNGGLSDPGLEITHVIVDPSDADRVFVSAHTAFGWDGGVWMTPDGGGHWNQITGDIHDWSVTALALDQNGETLFAGTEGGSTHRIDTRCGLDAECLDSNECTIDTCNPTDPTSDGFGCVHVQPDPNCVDQCDADAECQSGDLCEIWQCAPGDPDADAGGCLLASEVDCTAPDVCHDSYCNSSSGQCVVTANTGRVCDDGEACTYLDRCQAGVCKGSQEPVASCKTSTPRASVLSIRNSPAPGKDKLAFSFRKGTLTNASDFGNPFNVGGTGYLVCLYDHSGAGGTSRLLAGATVSPGGGCGARPCWSPKSSGFRYHDRAALGDGGIDTLELIPGAASKVTLKAHGAGMETPAGPMSSAVTLQVRRTDTSTGCWGASFSAPNIKKNDAQGFKARSD